MLVLFLILVLVLSLVLLLFPVAAVFEIAVTDLGAFEDPEGLALLGRERLTIGSLLFALLSIILPGLEQHLQPRHHLVDRRKLSRRSRLAARTLWSGLASGPL